MGQLRRERQERFELLFESYHAQVATYVRRRAPSEVVEDVVEETFLVAWRRFERVPSEPLPWLYGVARRVLANERRSGRRAEALAERLAHEAERGPAGDGMRGLSADLDAALRAVSEREREAVLLIAWEGLTPSQAAVAAGCSAAAFRVRLHRARRQLTLALDQPVRATSEERLDPLSGIES